MKVIPFLYPKLILIFKIIKYCKLICDDKHLPFLKEGECTSYCSLEDLRDNVCIIDNDIVKTQWINNIIYLSGDELKYINMAVTQKDDLLILMSNYPKTNTRALYGITRDGIGYFNGNKTYSMEINDPNTRGRFESEIFIIKLSNISSNKEYIMSYGKTSQYCEIYDLESKIIYFKDIETMFYQLYTVDQTIGAYLKLTTTDYNYYLIGLISAIYDNLGVGKPILSLIKFRIDSLGATINRTFYKVEVPLNKTKIVSCYEISSKYIICFYKSIDNKYTIGAFSPNLEKKKTEEVALADHNENKFFKCVHFYNEIGTFIYYSNNDPPYATLLFKKYCKNSDLITEEYSRIQFNEYSFFYNGTLNEFIKISDRKIYFVAVSLDRTKLFIISIYNYNQNKIIQRIYEIDSFTYNGYSFYNTIRLSTFRNYLALGSNGFLGNKGTVISLIIFSYPNSTDIENELTKYLLNNNDIKINNITLEAKNLCKIENNIFGLILTEIKILEINKNSSEYLSLHDDKELGQDFLPINESLKLIISKTGSIYKRFIYTIKYICQAVEPDYEVYNRYPIYINDTETPSEEINYFEKKTYLGRISYYKFILNNELTDEGCNEECELCYYENKESCVTCRLGSNIIDGNKICDEKLITTIIETSIPKPIPTSSNIVQCNVKFIIEGICQGELTDEMGKDIYLYIKYELINENLTEENILIKTPSIAFQLTELDYQKNNNLNISIIDIGECEQKIKKEFNISKEYDLIIFKIDIYNFDKTLTYVQYEIYDPITFKQLDLDICKDIPINITISATLDSEVLLVYRDLNNKGYNLFNSNDFFYNDICTPYTTINNTDMLLIDRKTDIYNKYANLTICQENCDLSSYNDNFKKASCFCNIQSENTTIDLNIQSKFDIKGITDIFLNYISNSNFRVLECYKVAFDLSNIIENIGRIIMTIILLIFIALFIIFLIKGNKEISIHLNNIKNSKLMNKEVKNNLEKKNNIKDKKAKESLIDNKNKNKKINFKYIKNKDNKNKLSNPIKNKNNKNNKKLKDQKKENRKKNCVNSSSKNTISTFNSNINLYKIKTLNKKNKNKNFKEKEKEKKKKNEMEKEKKSNSKKNKNNIFFCNIINNFNNKSNLKNNKVIIKNHNLLNDQELNSLKYEDALILDKRTFFQYYCSLLKKNHLILFAFLPVNDYNLQYIKIMIFLISFSLYYSVNGFFFNDEIIHQIYADSGIINYLYQIASILYSSIIPSIIKLLLKLLSLTEMDILSLKKQKNKKKFIKMVNDIEKCFKIKFAIFFTFSFLLLFFFWYFISCFCGVYKNTQKALIIDTLFSFGLSMLYPFGIYLLPGMLRIPALRANKKDKKCLYQISTLVSLI